MAATRYLGLSTTGQVAKAAAGRLRGLYATNTGAAVAFLKIYNKATAATQADTPRMTIPIPIGGIPAGFLGWDESFDTGISVRASTGAADNDTGAPGSNEVIVHLDIG